MLSQENIIQLGKFLGRKCEVDLSPTNSANTYKQFCLQNKEDALVFYSGDWDNPQQLFVKKDDIENVEFLEGETIFQSVLTITLRDNKGRIDICVSEHPVKCCACGNYINLPYDTNWKISGIGNYGSIFDGERLDLDLCDHCLELLLISKDDDEFNLDKKKDLLKQA